MHDTPSRGLFLRLCGRGNTMALWGHAFSWEEKAWTTAYILYTRVIHSLQISSDLLLYCSLDNNMKCLDKVKKKLAALTLDELAL